MEKTLGLDQMFCLFHGVCCPCRLFVFYWVCFNSIIMRVCVCVCSPVCVFACMQHACMCVCMHVSVSLCLYVCM